MSKPAWTIEQNARKERRSGLIAAARLEQRDGRASVELPVRFQRGDEVVRAVARNVSVGGMFIATDSPAAYGATITVEMPLPGLTELASIAATVRWTNDEGMGVQFGVMGARETHGLLRVVRETESE